MTSYRDGVFRYAMWDAAYVLGSLSAADRREFEAHMANCPACRDAVADLVACRPCFRSLTVKRSPRSTSPALPSRRHLRCRRSYCRSIYFSHLHTDSKWLAEAHKICTLHLSGTDDDQLMDMVQADLNVPDSVSPTVVGDAEGALGC